MNEHASNSNPLNELSRCQHRTAKGRRCRHAVSDAPSGLCARHVNLNRKNSQEADLTADILGELQDFRSAADVNRVLGKLFIVLTKNRIASRRAAVLAYIGNLLLRSVYAVECENQSDTTNPQIIIDVPRPRYYDSFTPPSSSSSPSQT